MKSVAAILFFIIILLQTFSSFVIQANYLLNRDYIVKVLCVNRAKPKMHCNGKCYLAKQLKEQEQQDQQSPNTKREKIDIQLFVVTPTPGCVPIQHISKRTYKDYPKAPLSTFPRSVFHPPSASII